jgi:hypothetical protein
MSTRDEILARRGTACPFHARCCRDWNINPDEDVCAHEMKSTVSICPCLVEKGGQLEYTNHATAETEGSPSPGDD